MLEVQHCQLLERRLPLFQETTMFMAGGSSIRLLCFLSSLSTQGLINFGAFSPCGYILFSIQGMCYICSRDAKYHLRVALSRLASSSTFEWTLLGVLNVENKTRCHLNLLLWSAAWFTHWLSLCLPHLEALIPTTHNQWMVCCNAKGLTFPFTSAIIP